MLHRKLLLRRSDTHSNISSIALKSFSIYVVPRVSPSTSLSQYGPIHHHRRFSHQSDKPTTPSPPPTTSSSSSSRMTTIVTFTQQSVVYIGHAVVDVIRNPKATWQYIKHEAEHYWLGTKLLWSEIKLATKIFTRVLYGHGMTRR